MGHHRPDTLAGGASSDGRFRRIATRSILLAVSVALVDPLQTAACALAAGGRAGRDICIQHELCSELAPSDTLIFLQLGNCADRFPSREPPSFVSNGSLRGVS
jgi:hypothetical protein